MELLLYLLLPVALITAIIIFTNKMVSNRESDHVKDMQDFNYSLKVADFELAAKKALLLLKNPVLGFSDVKRIQQILDENYDQFSDPEIIQNAINSRLVDWGKFEELRRTSKNKEFFEDDNTEEGQQDEFEVT